MPTHKSFIRVDFDRCVYISETQRSLHSLNNPESIFIKCALLEEVFGKFLYETEMMYFSSIRADRSLD